jgi:hypothetical protein
VYIVKINWLFWNPFIGVNYRCCLECVFGLDRSISDLFIPFLWAKVFYIKLKTNWRNSIPRPDPSRQWAESNSELEYQSDSAENSTNSRVADNECTSIVEDICWGVRSV